MPPHARTTTSFESQGLMLADGCVVAGVSSLAWSFLGEVLHSFGGGSNRVAILVTLIITFSTSLCIMVESWTEPFAYLVIRWKLYYVKTCHMSTQMKVHRWQKNCKRSCFKEHSGTCQHCKYLPNTARSSHCKPSTVGRRWYSRYTAKIDHNILFHHEKRSFSSQAYIRTDFSIWLPYIRLQGIGYSQRPHIIK